MLKFVQFRFLIFGAIIPYDIGVLNDTKMHMKVNRWDLGIFVMKTSGCSRLGHLRKIVKDSDLAGLKLTSYLSAYAEIRSNSFSS